MQALSQLLNSGTTLYRESKHSTRWTLLFCLLLVGVSMVTLFSHSTVEMESLFSGREFSPSEISQITQSFSVAQLDQWETSGKQIKIPRSQRAQYIAALQGNFDVNSMTSVVDTVLQQGHFLDTPSLRDLRLRNAKEKDLAKMLMQIPGIEEARVNIDEQHERGLSGGKKMVALAALKATGNSKIGMDTAESIREIIAARYAGLQRSEVVVIDLNTGYTFGSSNGVFPSSDEDMAMRHYERWWKNRIEYLLSDIPLKRIEVSLRIAGNVPLANPHDPTQPQSRVRASVSVGIPHSYVQQVALKQLSNPAGLSAEQFQAAVSKQEFQIKQNVTTLVRGVVPIVPRSVVEPLQVNVATIVDLSKTTLSRPMQDPMTAQLRQHWKEAVMGLLVIITSWVFIKHIQKRRSVPNNLEKINELEEAPVPNMNNATSPDSRVNAPDALAQTHHAKQLVPQLQTSEATEEVHATREPALELNLTNELDRLLDESPADAADILRQWINRTS